MTTDTKAVARWDAGQVVNPRANGKYVLFTDHERVVGEHKDQLNKFISEAERTFEVYETDLAASRAEVEGLKKDAERYRWLKTGGAPAVSYLEMCPSSNSWDQAIDAAMENSNV